VRIDEVVSYTTDDLVAVVVRTDDGVEGVGQTAPRHAAVTAHVLHDIVVPYFLGRDPWDLEALVDRFLREHYKYGGGFLLRALGGVETALWDVLGKSAGRPVYQLLGGAVRDAVPVYASSMSRAVTPEAEADRLGQLIADHGFGCVKVRIGGRMGRDRDAWPGRTEAIIPFVRRKLGPDVDINADANSGFSAARAIQVGRLLEEHRYHHFEEPCEFSHLERTAEVAAALDIAVAGGEQDTSLAQFQRMLTIGAVDIVQPDVGYIGGVSRARRVALMAEAAGKPCTPHCANQSMLQVFTLHLAAAMPSCSQYQEWGIEKNAWAEGVYEPLPQVDDGKVPLPSGAGWGFELTPEFRRRATEVRQSV